METQNLVVSREDGVATVTVNRPAVLNALNRDTLRELGAVFLGLGHDPAVRVVVVTGAGEKAFVAGADIKELAENTALESNLHAQMGQELMNRIEGLGKPTIAAINGFALGGGLELALACTIRLASSRAKMGLPEMNLGIIPGFGGTQRLPRIVGQGRALHMILTGDPIDATRALEYGLVTAVHEPEELMGEAQKLAGKLASKSAATLRLADETVRGGAEMALREALAFEASQFGVAASTDDYAEGMAAFLEKRAAAFQGH